MFVIGGVQYVTQAGTGEAINMLALATSDGLPTSRSTHPSAGKFESCPGNPTFFLIVKITPKLLASALVALSDA